MDLSNHTMNTLFAQLGLPATDEDIEQFILQHKLEHDCQLVAAKFWTVSQVGFFQEAFQDDSDWVGLVDQLDACLRY